MRSIFISIMTFLMMTACTTAPEVNIGIVPAPVSVSVKEHGRFALGDNITVKAASEDLLAPAAVFFVFRICLYRLFPCLATRNMPCFFLLLPLVKKNAARGCFEGRRMCPGGAS